MCWGAQLRTSRGVVRAYPAASFTTRGLAEINSMTYRLPARPTATPLAMLMPVNGSTVPDDCESLRPMAAGMANTCQQFIASANSSKFPAMRSKWPAAGVASTTRPGPYSNGRDT